MNISDLGTGSNQQDWLDQQKALADDRARSEAAAAQQQANLDRIAAERIAAAAAATKQFQETGRISGVNSPVNDSLPQAETVNKFKDMDDATLIQALGIVHEGRNWTDSKGNPLTPAEVIAAMAAARGGKAIMPGVDFKGSGLEDDVIDNSGEGGYQSRIALQEQVANLEKLVGELLKANGGGVKRIERLFINVETERAKVEAAMRMGLNAGEFGVDDVQKGRTPVISWLAEKTGVEEAKVSQYLNQTLAAGASALTMVLSGGNFPLGAAAYFGTQALLPKAGSSSANGTKALFTGYEAEGSIDGQALEAYRVQLPYGLPHDIFGAYRFVCYDHLTGKWFPSDEITPLQYWSAENYRYTVLDRVTSKVYHCDYVKPVRLYV